MRRVERHRLLICPGLALLLYLIGLGTPPLWEPDEGRYAEIAREMVVAHDYVTPHNNFVIYFEKPPLVYWVTAASLRIFGRNEFAARLPAAIASAGQVAVTYALADAMFGATTATLAALALALSPLFFSFARFATPDPELAFFLTAALTSFYRGAQCAGALNGIDFRWMLASAVMLALATLTKGPVALLLGGAIALLWLMLQGRGRDGLRIGWLPCVALYLTITLPWFIVIAHGNPGFARFFLIHEHFQRYLASTEHGWGPWFYIPIIIAGTWPWIYFLPLAFTGFRVRSSLPPSSEKISAQGASIDNADERSSLHFLLIWCAVILVFFSIPRSKLGEYILPVLPPISILAGRGLARLDQIVAERKRLLLVTFASINTAAALAMTAAVLMAPAGGLRHALAGDAAIAAMALLAGGIAPLLISDCKADVIALQLAVSVIVALVAGNDARRRVAPWVSYRELAKAVAPYAQQGCKLMSFRHFEQALPFYTGARETLVDYRGELQPFGPLSDASGNVFATVEQLKNAWTGGHCTVLIANRVDVPMLINVLSPAPILIGCEGKKLALYNRPLDSPSQLPSGCFSTATKNP